LGKNFGDVVYYLAGRCPVPPESGIGGVQGHHMKGSYLAGSPFDMLRAVSSVERPRPFRAWSFTISLVILNLAFFIANIRAEV